MKKSVYILVILLLAVAPFVGAQTVYKTPTGSKYHLGSCRMVENVSAKLTVAEALEGGLDPCKICKPAVAPAQNLLSNNQSPKGESNTTQCKGLTRKGTRCQHKTSIADGYCFQHKPK